MFVFIFYRSIDTLTIWSICQPGPGNKFSLAVGVIRLNS